MSFVMYETYGTLRTNSSDLWGKMSIYTKFYPEKSNRSCSAILTMNLASPEWITVGCFEELKPPILCKFTEKTVKSDMSPRSGNLNIFHTECIMKQKRCLEFAPKSSYFGNKKRKELFLFQHVQDFEYIFDAVSEPFPPILLHNDLAAFKYQKHGAYYQYIKTSESEDLTNALKIYSLHPRTIQIGGNLLKCHKTGTTITIESSCNDINDCEDELPDFCGQGETKAELIKLGSTPKKQHQCLPFYLMRPNGTCDLYTDFSFLPSLKTNLEKTAFENKNILDLGSDFKCNESHHLICGQADHSCYNISHICVFETLKSGVLVPCKQGEHMQNCASFECNMMFKCPRYYCLPWQNVCDGKWDCPGGLDENVASCISTNQCGNMMKCPKSQICLHLGQVCDSKAQCPFEDDEKLCSLHNTPCPEVCQCLTYALVCSSVFQWNFAQGMLPFYAVFANDCSSLMIQALFTLLHHAVLVAISNNQLCAVCGLVKNVHLLHLLDAGYNNVDKVDPFCFPKPAKLALLNVNNNKIDKLFSHSFANLPLLKFLNLSNNILLNFDGVLFHEYHRICLIDFSKTQLTNVNQKYFSQLGNAFVISDDLGVCCWMFSGMIGLIVLTLNFSIIVVHFVARRTTFYPQVACLHSSECFYGVSLCFLFISNFHNNTFTVHPEPKWMSDITCSVHFTFSTFYTWIIPALLILMSFTQMIAVKTPLNAKHKTKKLNCVVVYLVVFCIIVSFGFTFTFQNLGSGIPFRTCSLQILSVSTPFWPRRAASLLLIPHIIVVCFITFFYYSIWQELKASQGNLQGKVSKQLSIKQVLLQLVILWTATF